MLLLTLALSGCAFVSDADVQAQKDLYADDTGVGDDTGDPSACEPSDEVCNGIDDDCDGDVDEDLTATWYADTDGDGFGDPEAEEVSCGGPDFVDNDEDCDDSSANVRPTADEACNGRDDDCDGIVDEDALDAGLWYLDADNDGFGGDEFVDGCNPNDGRAWRASGGDCDDGNANVAPGKTETCNGVDDDCNGSVDDGVSPPPWYPDTDGDGFGADVPPTNACVAPGSAWAPNNEDCDDTDLSISPSSTETWYDGVDQDCNGGSDYDQDGDGADTVDNGGTDRDDLDPDCDVDCTDGAAQNRAGDSCEDINLDHSITTDGVRWLDPDGDGDPVNAFEAFCDMSTDGGGWALIWKTEPNATFEWSSPLWEDSNLLDETNIDDSVGTAKLQGFIDIPFADIRLCTDLGCYAHTMSSPQTSATALFAAGYLNESIEDATDYQDWLDLFGVTGNTDCPPGQKPGFNTTGLQNTNARWGLMANHPDQGCQNLPTDDADGSVGIGLVSDDETVPQAASAGYTSSVVEVHDVNPTPVQVNAWLWVR